MTTFYYAIITSQNFVTRKEAPAFRNHFKTLIIQSERIKYLIQNPIEAHFHFKFSVIEAERGYEKNS